MECKKLKGCSEHGKCAKIPNSDDLKPHTCECDEVRIDLRHLNIYFCHLYFHAGLDGSVLRQGDLHGGLHGNVHGGAASYLTNCNQIPD